MELDYKFCGVSAPRHDDDVYSIRYASFVVPMVKALQEQQEMIETLQQENDQLKSTAAKIAELEAEMSRIKLLLE